jgi:hypothetical protein
MQRLCVILGAGASRAIRNEGVKLVREEFQPPLVRDLFDLDKHPDYYEIMAVYPGAQLLGSDIAPSVASGTAVLEQRLRSLAEHPAEEVRQHFKHIPPYLRDLIAACSHLYVTAPGCYLQLVIKLHADFPHDVIYLTTNYDTLIETALTMYQKSWAFNGINDYIRQDRPAKLVKIHGSANWFRLLPGQTHMWRSLVERLDITQKCPDDEIKVDNAVFSRVSEHAGDGGLAMYPILTAPLAGKSPQDVVCPTSHVDYARSLLQQCSKFLIVGSSGLDQDLLTLLDEAVRPDLQPLVHLVDYQSGAADANARFQADVRAFKNSQSVWRFVAFNQGFQRYLLSEDFVRFCKAD